MRAPLRPGVSLPLALAAGGAAALGQVPWSVWPLGLAGFAVGLWLVATAPGARSGWWCGWAFGAGHFFVALHWITEPFQVDAARDGWMAPFAWGLMAAGLALFWGLAGAVAAHAPRARLLAAVLALGAAEWARSVVLSGFPWALPGHLWLGHAPEQLAALGGAGALSLLTLGAAALLATGLRGAAGAAALVAAAFAFGHWQAGQPVPAPPGPVIRLVQPNADQSLKWQPEHAGTFFRRHLDLSAVPPDGPAPDLIVWPETAVPFLLEEPWDGLERMVAAAGATPVAFGVQRTEGLRGYNSLAVLGRDALGAPQVLAVYDKHHLVPFGEFIPGGDLAADWLSIPSFAPKEGYGYSPGTGPALLDLGPGLGRVLPLICYEAVFAYFPRAVDRPAWMLQVTNDAWFGDRSGPFQHLALNRLRSIETGLPLVRVANTGVSAVVDARGRITASLALNVQGHLDAALPAALPPTPYARFGGWPVAVLWLLGTLFLFRRGTVTH